MKARFSILAALAVLATGCIQDPDSPMNLPDTPTLSVDETSVTRVSMVVSGSFGPMTDVTAYGVEISETLFENGGTYTTLVPQEIGADGFSLGISDLKSNGTYFLRAFITNGHSKMYSSTLTQKTPETSVASVSDVTIKDNYYLVATIEDNGGRSVEDVGFMWGTSNERKSIKREKRYAATLDADGKTFTLPLSEVGEGTHYIMAYVEDDKDGTGYSRIPYEFELKGEDEAQIEDPEFKKYLVMYHDYNEDGKISYAELKQIEVIDVHTDNIRSVREIELMPLHSLMVSGMQQGSGKLTTLNVKKDTLLMSLDCSNNQIAELDVSANTLLEALYCQGNSLKTLNASMIPDLRYLNCERNPMETLYLSWYQRFNELLYPEGCRIVYVDKPEGQEQEQENSVIRYTSLDGNPMELDFSRAFDATVISNTREGGECVITFQGTVTTMYSNPFAYTPLVSITFPESLQTFDASMYGCDELESIHLPSHLKKVPGHFLAAHSKLRELEFPETDNIAEGWMNGPIAVCKNLETLTGPYATSDHKALIKDGKMFAFAGAGIKSYTVPSGVTSLGGEVFRSFDIEFVELPSSLTSIGYMCFAYTLIPSIEIPESVTMLGDNAFTGCGSLISIHIPEGTDIGEQLLDGCTSLEYLSGHYATDDGRCLIKDNNLYAFAPAGLEEYTIPEGVQRILSGLTWLWGVEAITLPQSLSDIFILTSTYLKRLTCLAQTPPSISSQFELTNIEAIYVPEASVDAYKAASGWSTYADKIQAMPDEGNVVPGLTASRYLTFTSEGTTSLSLIHVQNDPVVYYSTDAQNWSQWGSDAVTFSSGKPLYVCGNNPDGFSKDDSHFSYFDDEGSGFSVSGSVMSLINKDEDVYAIPSPYCFTKLFENTYILSTPFLPATTLTTGCYSEMFFGCPITVAPDLPATTLAADCYYEMFRNCPYLETAPALPATTLAIGCYEYMFYNCPLLTTAPDLPAPILIDRCYYKMFQSCNKLNYVKCLATDVSATDCVINWLREVSETGTFVKSADAQGWIEGFDGIPTGWTVMNDGQEQGITASQYLMFSSEGTSGVSLVNEGSNAPVLYYSYDRVSWTQWDYSELSFNNDDHVYIAGDNPGGFSHSFNDYSHFSVSGDRFSVTGSVMSLLDKDQALLVIPSENCFCRLFQSCTNLTHAPTLPATTLTTACYYQMFDGCSALYRAPEELPATVLAQECYYSMFSHCTSLDQDPFILATEVADYCCYNMFYGCTSLTAAQFLMAETLAPWCYGQMYAGCTNLESTSTLPAQTLVNGCYYHMFSNCEKLAYVECLATDISAEEATTTWLEGVASTGTFMKAPNAQWPTGYNGIPEGWTVENYSNN